MTLRHRSRRRAAAAVLTLVFATCSAVVAAQPASAAPAASPGAVTGSGISGGDGGSAGRPTLVPLKLSPDTAKKPYVATATGTATATAAAAASTAKQPALSTSTCGAVRAQLKQDAARHVREASCTTITPTAAKPAAQASAAEAAARIKPLASSWCGSQNGAWLADRTEMCIQNLTDNETIFDTDTGAVLGTATFLISQDILLQPTNTTFTENDTVYMQAAEGAADVPGTMEFSAGCDSPCQTLQGSYSAPLALGEVVNFALVYEDTPSPTATTPDSFLTHYVFDVLVPGTVNVNFATWDGGAPVRCDDLVGGQPAGCVFPVFTPELDLSLGTYGAAAANVLIGEAYLAGNPGSATPLTRGDPADTRSNRTAICDDGTFIDSTLVTDDSCDEYPFASSQQSGGALGLTGSACLEDLPVNVNGTWEVVFFNTVTGAQQCLRGHVPEDLNEAVGGQVISLINTNRLLIGDPYWVNVTS